MRLTQNINRGRIDRRCAFFFSTLLALSGIHSSATAQNEYEKIIPEKTDTSIVRYVKTGPFKNNMIVYTRYQNVSCFHMFSNGSETTKDLYLYSTYISDFIIKDSMNVYFCGYSIENDEKKSLIGSFSLTGFPRCLVALSNLDGFAEFKRIESYYIRHNTRKEDHFVMIANTTNNLSTLIDGYKTPDDKWQFFYLTPQQEHIKGYTFNDITVTNDYLVASSSPQKTQKANAYLWLFTLPNSTNTPILSTNIFEKSIQRVKYLGGSKLHVEALRNGFFATLYTTDSIIKQDNPFFYQMDIFHRNQHLYEYRISYQDNLLPNDPYTNVSHRVFDAKVCHGRQLIIGFTPNPNTIFPRPLATETKFMAFGPSILYDGNLLDFSGNARVFQDVHLTSFSQFDFDYSDPDCYCIVTDSDHSNAYLHLHKIKLGSYFSSACHSDGGKGIHLQKPHKVKTFSVLKLGISIASSYNRHYFQTSVPSSVIERICETE